MSERWFFFLIFWDYIFTYRAKQDNGRPVCCTVQKDVRGTFRNGLGKWGNEVVATFTITSFGRDESSRTIVRNTQARIDLQGMFTQYGNRWANLQIQWNGVHPSPTTFGSVFLQAEKTFPIPPYVWYETLSFRVCWDAPKFGLKFPQEREYLKTDLKTILIDNYSHIFAQNQFNIKRRTLQNIHHSAALFFLPTWL